MMETIQRSFDHFTQFFNLLFEFLDFQNLYFDLYLGFQFIDINF